MNIPKTLKIGAFDYDVFETETSKELESKYMGCSLVDKQEIHLDKSLKPQKKSAVFMHEILHSVFHSVSMDESPVSEHEEYIIDALSQGLYQVLKDNKLQF